jgi:hypothetical protein
MVEEPPDIGKMIGSAIERHFNTCVKCRRPFDQASPDADDWAIQAFMMKVVYARKCPNCQTDAERAEVEIRRAGGVQYKLKGLLLVEQPPPPPSGDDDEGTEAQAS